jgi:hypothetical protein
MAVNAAPSLVTLPVEIVYRILDNLSEEDILLSTRDVCRRLNAITDSYRRYQVNFHRYLQIRFSSVPRYHSFQIQIYFVRLPDDSGLEIFSFLNIAQQQISSC